MFGKKKPVDVDLAQWAERLEAGEWDDPEWATARLLHNTRPSAADLPEAERRALRQRLVTQHTRQRQPLYVALGYVRQAAWVAASLVLLLGIGQFFNSGLFGRFLKPAARATITPIINAGTILYERATIERKGNSPAMFIGGPPLFDEGVIESWYTPDLSSYRYQITNQTGQIVYFEQWHGNRWSYLQYLFSQPGATTLQPQLFSITIDNSAKTQMAWNDVSWLVGGLVEVAWSRLNIMLRQNQAQCRELFCLLGINAEDQRWQCEEERCILQRQGKELINVRLNRLDSPEAAYAVDVEPVQNQTLWFRLLFDRKSLKLLEVSERGFDGTTGLVIRTTGTPAPVVDSNLFDQLPKAVSKAEHPPNAGQAPLSAQLRYRLKSITPPPGTRIEQPTQIQVAIEYELSHYVKNAEFVVGLTARDEMPGQPMWPENSDSPLAEQRTGTITATINLDPTRLRSTLWDLQLYPNIRADNTEPLERPKIFWCIACDPKEFPVIEMSSVTYSSSKTVIHGTSNLSDDTCLTAQLSKLYDSAVGGRPVAWWPAPACIEVRRGYWRIEVEHKEIPVDDLLSNKIFALKIWAKAKPDQPTTLLIGPLD